MDLHPKVSSQLELIDVEPRVRSHRENALIEAVAEPGSDGMQHTIARFRCGEDESNNSIAVLELGAGDSEARCLVMIVSRRISLSEIAQGIGFLGAEVLGQQSASNGTTSLRMTLESTAAHRRFALRLALLPSPPNITVEATLALQKLRAPVEIQYMHLAEEGKLS